MDAVSRVGTTLKQAEAQDLLVRLEKLHSEFRNASALANSVADKLVGPRPEALSGTNAKETPPGNFLASLRSVVSALEEIPGSINSSLNRVDQSF